MNALSAIRMEQEKDFLAVKEINDLAFGQESESTLIGNIRNTDNYIPALSLVFENEKLEIIGHILFSPITIETKTESIPSLALAPMAVKPDLQNQGIGSSLVKAGLKRCEELGYKSIVVLGHPDYYPKFGFILASEKGIKCPFEVPNEAFMVYEIKPGALNDAQGTVKYPEAFSIT